MAITGPTDVNIRGLTADSHMVGPGFLFAALQGEKADGRKFIPEAIARGAVAILAPLGTRLNQQLKATASVSLIACNNPRLAYAVLSARYFGSQPEIVAAITGTNGKTSVAEFVRQIWTLGGVSSASLGTLGLLTSSGDNPSTLTTPDPAELHYKLSQLVRDDVNRLTLEASSHGLAQYRLDGVQVSIAAYTNLSRDHLDYHGNLANYISAKTRLFSEILMADGTAVLNGDDAYYETLRNTVMARGIDTLSYGWHGKDLRIDNLRVEAAGQWLELTVQDTKISIRLPLIGEFQAINALCALGIVMAAGAEPVDTASHLEKLVGVRGRLELAATLPNGAAVYVDYAHTPDALKKVLSAMRSHTNQNLHLVFGCGGKRDIGKRLEMGKIAATCADNVIITDDNPRTENAASIRRQVLEACDSATEIPDRGQAIFEAISRLNAGDLLVIAGKGHERGQVVGSDVLPFDDVEVAAKAVLSQYSSELCS